MLLFKYNFLKVHLENTSKFLIRLCKLTRKKK